MAGSAIEARAVAVRAGLAAQEFREFFADRARFRFAIAALEVGYDTLEAMPLLYLHAARVLVEELDLLAVAAVQHDIAEFLVELAERLFQVEVVMRSETLNHLVVVGGLASQEVEGSFVG